MPVDKKPDNKKQDDKKKQEKRRGPQDPLAPILASYEAILAGWLFPDSNGLRQFMHQAAEQGWSTTQFILNLRQTKEYARRFPGIMRENGSLRMSESQYIAGYNAAADYAASVGRNFSRQMYGYALRQGNSPAEIKAKINALDQIKEHKDLLGQFNEYLLATREIKKPLTKAELAKFVMREGPKQFEDAWETAQQAGALAQFGVDVGKPKTGSDVSYKQLKKLQGMLLPGQDPDYQALSDVLAAMPASQLYGMGLTKKDALAVAYGGARQQAVVDQAKKAVATYAARFEPQAHEQLTQRGLLTGAPEIQVTE